MLRNGFGRYRLKIVFLAFVVLLYVVAHISHNTKNNSWIPTSPPDTAPKKKNPDGPLIVRDNLFNDGKKNTGMRVLTGAVLIDNGSVDKTIIRVTEKPAIRINITSVFLANFKNSAKKVKNQTNDFVLFTVVNDAYYNMTSNFLCNIFALGGKDFHSKVLIVALRHSTCRKLLGDWPQITCLGIEADDQHNADIKWGRKTYVQILTFRARLLAELSKLEIPFILFESDSVWLKSPFPLISNATVVDDADIIVPVNGYPGKEKYAFDPMVAFPTDATKDFFRELLSQLEKDSDVMDQNVLNSLCSSQFNGVRCRNFDWEDVADGKWFKLSERQRKNYKPCIVNNNYYVGVKNKTARQAINGLWFLSPKGTCIAAQAKKKLAKYS